jgi:hypothetical protein
LGRTAASWRVHRAGGADHENQDGRDLDQHHHIVGVGAFLHAFHQNPGQDHQDQKRRDIEPVSGELPPTMGGLANLPEDASRRRYPARR